MKLHGHAHAPKREVATIDDPLRQAAEHYAGELNLLGVDASPEWLAEVAAESPYWDDRTNLLSLAADRPENAALVLATEPDGDDYVVIRWAGRWIVDDEPVDWEAMLEDLESGD